MKFEEIYDLGSFDTLGESATRRGVFADSALAGVVLARTLTTVDPKIFQKKYPALTFVNSGISVNNIGGSSNYVQSLRIVDQGGFVNAAEGGDNKGKISVSAETSLIAVIEREGFSEWTERQVAQADMQNINLVSQFLATHNKLYLQDLDSIGYLGNAIGSTAGVGLLNNSYFPSTGAAQTYAAATPQQLYDLMANLLNAQWNNVSNIPEYMANKVVVPIGMLNKMQTAILNTAAPGALSVYTALKMNFPTVDFVATYKTTTVAVAYSTSDEGMVMRIPQPLKVGEIIKPSSFKYKVDSTYSVAGLDILEKDAGYILTGLA